MMTGSVLLTTDGTYPCYPGGVSVWCNQLIRQLADIAFHVFAITYSPSHTPIFGRPDNLITQQVFPLWGSEHAGPQQPDLSSLLACRKRTTDQVIRNRFAGPLELCLRSMLQPGSAPEQMAESLVSLHTYFQEFDCSRSISSEYAWDTFLRVCHDFYPAGQRPTLEEAVTCMRWLERHLTVVAARLPQTDIVHASMAGLAGIPGVLQKQLYGTRFLLSEHGIFLRELYLSLAKMKDGAFCRRFLYSWHETVARMNYRYADSVSSLCEFNRKWQIRVGALPQKIRIIPNGIDSRVFFPPEAKPAGRDDSPVVLTMARIYPLKGIDHLLRAIRLVLNQLPHVRWRILGDAGDQQYYRDCRKLALDLRIEPSIEWSQTSDPATAYRSADVFCLPSISEATPYSVLESMFSGCPVVATDVGGVAEMLAGTGLVVPPRNPESLARALLSLLCGDDAHAYRKDLSTRALARARSLYTIENCSKGFRELYDQLSNTSRTACVSAAR
jgi:polysaccharide biosynthesis protein PelF